MQKNTISIPLYSRASDRSIEECSFRWHAERGGMDVAGASWFDIGTGMHTAYEEAIKGEWDLPTLTKFAVEEVLNLVTLGLDVTGGGENYLTSRHRPIDTASLTHLAVHLSGTWYNDIVLDPPDWLPPVYGGEWLLEEVVEIPHDHPEWEWEAGASTTIDALHPSGILVDWKTGRSRSSDKRQMLFYRYLLELKGMEFTSEPWAAFYHAEHGKWQTLDQWDYDPDEIEQLIGSSQALKKARPEARASWLCDYCPAKKLCPAWADDQFDAQVLQQQVEVNRSKYVYLLDPSH